MKGNCDAVNITDNQTAIVRMSSIGAGTIAHIDEPLAVDGNGFGPGLFAIYCEKRATSQHPVGAARRSIPLRLLLV